MPDASDENFINDFGYDDMDMMDAPHELDNNDFYINADNDASSPNDIYDINNIVMNLKSQKFF